MFVRAGIDLHATKVCSFLNFRGVVCLQELKTSDVIARAHSLSIVSCY